MDKPLLTDVLLEYPKFQSTPQLLDLEFETLLSASDFLSEFPAMMEQLRKYAEHSTVSAVQQCLQEAAGVDLDWKAWYAVKMLCLLLMPSIRKRISGAEVLPSLFRIVPVGSSLDEEVQQLSSYSPILLVQGEIGGVVASVKVAAERKLIEAGTTIVEGLDCLFKMFWIFNMAYPDNVSIVLKFLEYKVYNIKDGKKPSPTIRELGTCLSQYI